MRALRQTLSFAGLLAGIVALPAAVQAQQPVDVTGSITPPPLRLAETQPFEDQTGLRRATDLYRKGDIAGGDAAAAMLPEPSQKIAAEWVAIRSAGRSIGFRRISAFMERTTDLPMQNWLQRRAEDALMIEKPRPSVTLAFFEKRTPLGANGRAALAAAKFATGAVDEGRALALAAYRDRATTRDVAQFIETTFPGLVTEREKTLRAHRLILMDQIGEGTRIAAGVSPDHGKLAQAIAYAADKGSTMALLDQVPPALRSHPSFVKARSQVLRRSGATDAARDEMLKAPKTADDISEAEEWWIERRMLSRKLLDGGDVGGAYRVAAEAVGL
jgi:soluble lytic murein transglycosylase